MLDKKFLDLILMFVYHFPNFASLLLLLLVVVVLSLLLYHYFYYYYYPERNLGFLLTRPPTVFCCWRLSPRSCFGSPPTNSAGSGFPLPKLFSPAHRIVC